MLKPAHRLDDPRISDEIASAIEGVEQHDLVIVNDDRRTWRVTEIVRETFDEDDAREHKRVIRLETKNAEYGLILREFPERYEAEMRTLRTNQWIEQEIERFAVETVRVIDAKPDWVVVGNHDGECYHRADPVAMLDGVAEPLCDNGAAYKTKGSGFSLERSHDVFPRLLPCKFCFRHKALDTVSCPACGTTITDGVLLGTDQELVHGLDAECPQCDFQGVVSRGE